MFRLPVTVRVGGPDDLAVFQRVLYEALAWDPDERLPAMDVVLAHPEAARYHQGWGRPGDLGVVAEVERSPVGAAYCRLFTTDDHGDGFVDERTPEVAIAVWGGHRGEGIGTSLLKSLEQEASAVGVDRLSLSVDKRNPAVRLYTRTGYVTIDDGGSSLRMLKTLD